MVRNKDEKKKKKEEEEEEEERKMMKKHKRKKKKKKKKKKKMLRTRVTPDMSTHETNHRLFFVLLLTRRSPRLKGNSPSERV